MNVQATSVTRRVLPFLGTCTLALLATGLRTTDTNWTLVMVATVVAATVAVTALASRWNPLTQLAWFSLPFVVDVVIALLRQAQGGSTSGYSPLAILPVVWVGLTQGPRVVAAITAWTALLFAVPIVIVGAPFYPATGWRGVALWTVVATVIGFGAHRVIEAKRLATAVSDSRAAGLDRLIATQTAIATADLDVDGLMSLVASGALRVAGGDAACVEMLDGDEVVCSAVAGDAIPYLGLRLRADSSITGECFRSGHILLCTDSEQDSRVGREACRLVGARSLIVVPLIHGSDVKGVLIVWSAVAHDFRGHESQLLSLLASTSGAALVRAELIAELTALAVTDELTGLANRRAWHQHLEAAIARSAGNGQPLSVLILDLDGFKHVNDQLGHAAGDQLLQAASSAWLSALRASDTLGRTGGDEFAVILEQTDQTAALEVIDRLDRVLTGRQHASTGLATWNGNEHVAALIARADASMYKRKRERAAGERPAA